jgi:hypothetical protein
VSRAVGLSGTVRQLERDLDAVGQAGLRLDGQLHERLVHEGVQEAIDVTRLELDVDGLLRS